MRGTKRGENSSSYHLRCFNKNKNKHFFNFNFIKITRQDKKNKTIDSLECKILKSFSSWYHHTIFNSYDDRAFTTFLRREFFKSTESIKMLFQEEQFLNF